MFYYKLAIISVVLIGFTSWWGHTATLNRNDVYQWLRDDTFDEIMAKMSSVTADNCRSKPREELRLGPDTVAQKPRYNLLLSTRIYANRSSLLHMHNMALNRAFFFSFIYQQQNMSADFENQPGLQYLYMSTAADVSASQGFINGSAMYFDNNCSYPQWYLNYGVEFNHTLPLFGPRAWRADDFDEPTNWLREPTNNTIEVQDYGAGTLKNYSDPGFKTAPWYSYWLPDLNKATDSTTKFTYYAEVRLSNGTGSFLTNSFQTFDFFGPPQPGQQDTGISLPVQWTEPYYDCGRSNRWIVSAHSPVVEYMPRYSNWTHMRRPRFTAVVTQDIEFERIDINPCPISEGNPVPNYFAGTARCKPTTMCEPLQGFGFRRGGYQCVCRPGYYFPWWHGGPFMGEEIEIATNEEYEAGFDCFPVEEMMVIPNENPTFVTRRRRSATVIDNKKSTFMRLVKPESPRVRMVARRDVSKADLKAKLIERQFVPRYTGESRHIRNKRDLFDAEKMIRMEKILSRKNMTRPSNCATKPDHELYLPGDVAFGVEKQFEAEGRTALRLAHFLSDFLQNVDEYENFGNMRGDRRMNETHIIGEVLANVMGNFKILGCGVFFERHKFRMSPPLNNTDPRYSNGVVKEFFGPYAWRKYATSLNTRTVHEYSIIDTAGFQKYYTDESWYRVVKQRWQSNFHHLTRHTVKPMVRSDINGTSLVRFEYYPLTYYAAKYEHGEWLRPNFICGDTQGITVNNWVVSYVVPFFGHNQLKTRLEFMGVVKVDVELDWLDINQCPQDFHIANAFKNTARCHFKTQNCVPYPGRRFERGSYKCECRYGYEYPFNDLAWFFDGQTMEQEYRKLLAGEPNRYHTLKCRIAGASSIIASWTVTAISLLTFLFWQRV